MRRWIYRLWVAALILLAIAILWMLFNREAPPEPAPDDLRDAKREPAANAY